jgi:hypothetical protein
LRYKSLSDCDFIHIYCGDPVIWTKSVAALVGCVAALTSSRHISDLLTAPCGGFDKSADVDRFDGIDSHIWSTIYLTLRGRVAE